jgi:hypothetical protein
MLLEEGSKEAVEIHVLLIRSLFGYTVLRGLLLLPFKLGKRLVNCHA